MVGGSPEKERLLPNLSVQIFIQFSHANKWTLSFCSVGKPLYWRKYIFANFKDFLYLPIKNLTAVRSRLEIWPTTERSLKILARPPSSLQQRGKKIITTAEKYYWPTDSHLFINEMKLPQPLINDAVFFILISSISCLCDVFSYQDRYWKSMVSGYRVVSEILHWYWNGRQIEIAGYKFMGRFVEADLEREDFFSATCWLWTISMNWVFSLETSCFLGILYDFFTTS